MKFIGISRVFSLENEEQYNTIGLFWDEMTEMYGLENIQGLGYKWEFGKIYYAIGLKNGVINGADFIIELPNDGWCIKNGYTDSLKDIYDEIYKDGVLKYEIETFTTDGKCQIRYFR